MRKSKIIRNNKSSAKIFSAAALTGIVAFGAPVYSQDNVDLPIDMNISNTVQWSNGSADNPADIAITHPDGTTKYYHYENQKTNNDYIDQTQVIHDFEGFGTGWYGFDTIEGNYIRNKGGILDIYNDVDMAGGNEYGNKFSGNFIDNSSENNGSVFRYRDRGGIGTYNAIKVMSGNFIGNHVISGKKDVDGGAIALENVYYDTMHIESLSGSFLGNYAKSETGTARGGAIYVGGNNSVRITASDGNSTVFMGNYTESQGVRDDNAIYVGGEDGYSIGWLGFTTTKNGKIYMYDNVDGNKGYCVTITGDGTGTFGLYNDLRNADVRLENTHLTTLNNDIHTYNFAQLTISKDISMSLDVDLKNKSMDRLVADSYGTHAGNINVTGMNLLSDAAEGEKVTAVYFAEPGLKDNVTNVVSEIPNSSYQTSVYTPIYKYNVKYDTTTDYGKGDGGYFLFTKGDRIFTDNNGGGPTTTPSGNPSDAFNPSVLSAPISSVASSQATLNETFKYVFEHADTFTKMPVLDRMAKINANKYAISTDFNHNLGSLCPEHNNKAGWYKPYITFEKMDLKNGPKVNATTYGSLAGFDTDFFEHKNGWHSVGTGYVGYNGSQLRYKGIDTTMNGGILGYTHTMYKGNFWSALTLSAGASVGQSNTMYGKEDFTSLLAGVGSKTGYNFEFKEGKYILQPIMFLSYTFVNTFDYTNAAGVRINADPAHSIQLNPSIRFITNTKTGWQPYASVGMVWNVMNENKVTANDVRLPEMGMKPYVEYGVGVQKNWKDRFTAFGQAMLRNGGRTGIALSGGFRWALGHEGSPIKKQEKLKHLQLISLLVQPLRKK